MLKVEGKQRDSQETRVKMFGDSGLRHRILQLFNVHFLRAQAWAYYTFRFYCCLVILPTFRMAQTLKTEEVGEGTWESEEKKNEVGRGGESTSLTSFSNNFERGLDSRYLLYSAAPSISSFPVLFASCPRCLFCYWIPHTSKVVAV